MFVIQIENLTKHYGKLLAIKALISRSNKRGFGFIGPKDAGKTITV